MRHADHILSRLDSHLSSRIELTLYGRAALALGFDETPEDYALSRDVDAVMWIGQAEALLESTNFWEAVEQTNQELAEDDLYVSHFFTEDQVVLLPDWKRNRVALPRSYRHLDLHRLGNQDLLLSKLMRDDPIDHADALFIADRAGLGPQDIRSAVSRARLPESEEVREQFALASSRLLSALENSP